MDVIDRLAEVIKENGIEEDTAIRIANAMRFEYGGELVYVPKRPESIKHAIFKDLKAGASQNDIVKKFRVSKITAYRMMRKVKRGII